MMPPPSWEVLYRASAFIAEEMGVALKRSALSPNIRERLDHSCALADERGRIVAQAEHIPVHLGSFRVGLSNALSWLEKEGLELGEGDMLALNDPYISGTHLNDVMLLAPVYYRGEVVAYVVNKAHHVDIGGPVPGSINPQARTLYEEGLIIPPVRLVRAGHLDEGLLGLIEANVKAAHVSRGDLGAQLAANLRGIRMLQELLERRGLEALREAWERALAHGRELALRQMGSWRAGTYEAEDYLELGERDLRIRLRLQIGERGIRADFTGTDQEVEAPLNAVYGVTYSATAFAVRCALEREVPTNEGFYALIEVRAPLGSLVNPHRPAPVAGGNLETSQRVADVAFRALAQALPHRIPAAGSGTMMNVLLGGVGPAGPWAYYETIGGGTGARPGRHGVSAVQVNMTNTLNTPIEVAERAYPLLFTAYRIREGSGGRGRYRGGDGIVRAFGVLERCRLSLLADRFRNPPWGLWGGEAGRPGAAHVRRAKGQELALPSKCTLELEPGDEVILETPGGGAMYPEP